MGCMACTHSSRSPWPGSHMHLQSGRVWTEDRWFQRMSLGPVIVVWRGWDCWTLPLHDLSLHSVSHPCRDQLGRVHRSAGSATRGWGQSWIASRPTLDSYTVLSLPHSLCQSISLDKPTFKGWRARPHFSAGGDKKYIIIFNPPWL